MPSRLLYLKKIQGNVNVHPVVFAAEEGCQALTFLQLLRRLPFLPPLLMLLLGWLRFWELLFLCARVFVFFAFIFGPSYCSLYWWQFRGHSGATSSATTAAAAAVAATTTADDDGKSKIDQGIVRVWEWSWLAQHCSNYGCTKPKLGQRSFCCRFCCCKNGRRQW